MQMLDEIGLGDEMEMWRLQAHIRAQEIQCLRSVCSLNEEVIDCLEQFLVAD